MYRFKNKIGQLIYKNDRNLDVKTMKKLLLALFCSVPTFVFANDLMQFEGQCFVVDQNNTVENCTIVVGNDGKDTFSALKMSNHIFMIQTPLNCAGTIGCKAKLGTGKADLKTAKFYVRDGKTQKITNEAKENDWGCFKQCKT